MIVRSLKNGCVNVNNEIKRNDKVEMLSWVIKGLRIWMVIKIIVIMVVIK